MIPQEVYVIQTSMIRNGREKHTTTHQASASPTPRVRLAFQGVDRGQSLLSVWKLKVILGGSSHLYSK